MSCSDFSTMYMTWYLVSSQGNDHCNDVIMGAMASQTTSLTLVYSTVYSGADQRKHQSSASLAFAWGIHRWSVNYPRKWPVTRKIFSFDDVIMDYHASVSVPISHIRIVIISQNYMLCKYHRRCQYIYVYSHTDNGTRCRNMLTLSWSVCSLQW